MIRVPATFVLRVICVTADAMPSFTVFDKDQRVTHAAIVENKRLGEVLAFIKSQQDLRPPPRPKTNSERIGYRKEGRTSLGKNSFVDRMAEQRMSPVARLQT